MFDRFLLNTDLPHYTLKAIDWFEGEATFRKLADDVSRTAWALSQLRELKPALIALRCQDPYQHWVFILSLARLGLASASLPAVVDMNFKRALKALNPDIVISDRDGDIDVEGRQLLVLNDAWFKHVSESGEKFNGTIPIKPDDIGRVALAGAADAAPQRMSLTYQYIEISILHLLFQDIVSYNRHRNDFRVVPTLGSETPSGFLIILAGLTAGTCIQMVMATQLGVAFSQKIPSVAVVSPRQVEMILTQLPPGMQPLDTLYLTVAGGRLPAALYSRIRQSLTRNVQVVYGSDECGPVTFGDPGALGDEAAVGRAAPWITLQIVDDAGRPLPNESEGTVRLTGTGVIGKYDDNPALTEKRFRDGWFYPGDRGVIDAAGVLRISGRVDDLVSFGGDKFDLGALDARLQACPGIKEGAMFVAPDDNGLSVPLAALVTVPDFKLDVLSAWMREVFPNLPEVTAVWIDRLPRNESGAPDRERLVKALSSM